MSPRIQRTYRRVATTFWTDPEVRGRRLSRDELLLLLYTFTSPHSNLAGLYWLPLTYAAGETGIDLARVEEWVETTLSPYLTYDASTEELLVHRLAWHNIGEDLKLKDNRTKAINRALQDAHSRPLVEKFLELYAEWPLDRQKVAPTLDPEGAYQGATPSPLPKGLTKGLGSPILPYPTLAGTRQGAINHPPPSGNSEGADSREPLREDDEDLELEISRHLPRARINLIALHGGTQDTVLIAGQEVGIGIDIRRFERFCRLRRDPPEIVAQAIAHLAAVTGLDLPISLARWETEKDGHRVYEQCVSRAYKGETSSLPGAMPPPSAKPTGRRGLGRVADIVKGLGRSTANP